MRRGCRGEGWAGSWPAPQPSLGWRCSYAEHVPLILPCSPPGPRLRPAKQALPARPGRPALPWRARAACAWRQQVVSYGRAAPGPPALTPPRPAGSRYPLGAPAAGPSLSSVSHLRSRSSPPPHRGQGCGPRSGFCASRRSPPRQALGFSEYFRQF
jgi:hypothetical protein